MLEVCSLGGRAYVREGAPQKSGDARMEEDHVGGWEKASKDDGVLAKFS